MTDQLRSIHSRWQNLEADKVAISEDLKELFAEAKGNGYDTKALRAAFRLKAMDASKVAEFAEHETLVDLYLDALGVGTKDAIARTRVAREEPWNPRAQPLIDELAAKRDAEDALEIPTFLRRTG